MNKVSGTKSKLMRWALVWSDLYFDIYYDAGAINQAADSLSRNPACDYEPDNPLPEPDVSLLFGGLR